MARTRAINVILVQALDRWGRSVQDLILTMAELETLGVAFVVPGHIDMSTSMGRMMTHLLSAVTEFERELIRERVRSGLANARAKGKGRGQYFHAAACPQKNTGRLTVENQPSEPSLPEWFNLVWSQLVSTGETGVLTGTARVTGKKPFGHGGQQRRLCRISKAFAPVMQRGYGDPACAQ